MGDVVHAVTSIPLHVIALCGFVAVVFGVGSVLEFRRPKDEHRSMDELRRDESLR